MKESLCSNELQHLLLKREPRQREKEFQQIYIPQEFPQNFISDRSEKPLRSYEVVDQDIARDINNVQRQRMIQTQFMNNNNQFLQKFDNINQMIKTSMKK